MAVWDWCLSPIFLWLGWLVLIKSIRLKCWWFRKEIIGWGQVWTRGGQEMVMTTGFNAHLIKSRLPSEECKTKVHESRCSVRRMTGFWSTIREKWHREKMKRSFSIWWRRNRWLQAEPGSHWKVGTESSHSRKHTELSYCRYSICDLSSRGGLSQEDSPSCSTCLQLNQLWGHWICPDLPNL